MHSHDHNKVRPTLTKSVTVFAEEKYKEVPSDVPTSLLCREMGRKEEIHIYQRPSRVPRSHPAQ